MNVEINSVMNGYTVNLIDRDYTKTYVYNNTQEFQMFQDVAKFLFDWKIKIEKV